MDITIFLLVLTGFVNRLSIKSYYKNVDVPHLTFKTNALGTRTAHTMTTRTAHTMTTRTAHTMTTRTAHIMTTQTAHTTTTQTARTMIILQESNSDVNNITHT